MNSHDAMKAQRALDLVNRPPRRWNDKALLVCAAALSPWLLIVIVVGFVRGCA